jgi:hypothetical protein
LLLLLVLWLVLLQVLVAAAPGLLSSPWLDVVEAHTELRRRSSHWSCSSRLASTTAGFAAAGVQAVVEKDWLLAAATAWYEDSCAGWPLEVPNVTSRTFNSAEALLKTDPGAVPRGTIRPRADVVISGALSPM